MRVEPNRVPVVVLIAAAVAVALFARLSFLGQPFQNDAGIYVYLGKLLWTGGRLYTDLWETKLPTVPLLTAPLYGLFGNHWAGYVLTQAALGVVAAVALAWAVGRYVDPAGRVPTLLFALVGFNLSRLTITGFQLETVQLFFETLAACATLRCLSRPAVGPAVLAGALAALAAFAKPTGLSVAAAAGLALLWRAARDGRGWGPVFGLAVGVLAPVAAAVAWVRHSSFAGEVPNLLREISLYASGTPWRSLLQPKTAVFFLLPAVPWAVRAPLVGRRPAPRPATAVTLFAAVWMAAEVLAVVLQRRLYGYHFLVLMPPAALLFGLRPRVGRVWPAAVAVLPLAVVSAYFALPGWSDLAHGRGRAMPVSAYVAAHTAPTDAVWSDPACRLLLEADRPAGARLQMTFYLVNHDDAPRHFADLILSDFDARRPAVIVLPTGWDGRVRQVAAETPGLMWNPGRRAAYLAAIGRIDAYVRSHYRHEATVAGQQVFRRRPSPSSASAPSSSSPADPEPG